MRVSRQVAADNRERMLGAAARLFREKGFSGVGVDELTREVGLTYGSLYSQFGSKDGLAAEAVADTLGKSATLWEQAAVKATQDGGDPFVALVDRYLSLEHRDRAGGGCVLGTLAAEAPRSSAAVRDSFIQGAVGLADVLARHAGKDSAAACRQRAFGALSAMVGGIILARTVCDADLSAEILASARAAAIAEPAPAGKMTAGKMTAGKMTAETTTAEEPTDVR